MTGQTRKKAEVREDTSARVGAIQISSQNDVVKAPP